MLIDSHCHLDQLDLSPYEGDLDRVIAEANEQDVQHLLCVCIDMNNFPAVLAIAQRYPNIAASVGVHPNERDSHDPSVDELVALTQDPNVIAIGETGLDYFRSTGDLDWQHQRFRRHIRAAIETDLPLIIHTRDAREDTIEILRDEGQGKVRGVLHCFTETWEMAQAGMDLGFYVSFSGIVTFNNAKPLQEVAKKMPLDRMLVETDAPYLAPVPHRGKSNVPAYTRHVADFIAALRGEDYETIAAQTTANFCELFAYSV